MAVLVALGAGMIGSAIFGAGTLGAQLFFLGGSLLGSMLFGGQQGGARLRDLQVTSSTYGAAIPRGWGTFRIGGNIIWSYPLKEHSHSVGKGGGGGTTYTYSWTGAVGLCAGPIVDVIRIWADTKLVYDKTGQSANLYNKYKIKVRIYKGDETQLPDPALESLVGTSKATAHRGLAYVVFDNIPLQDYGNRVPSWSFEVAVSGSAVPTTTAETFVFNQEGVNTAMAFPIWAQQRAIFFGTGGGLYSLPLNTPTNTNLMINYPSNYKNLTAVGLTTAIDPNRTTVGYDGYIYGQENSGANYDIVYKIDSNTLIKVGSYGADSSSNNTEGTYIPLIATNGIVPFVLDGVNYLLTVGEGGIAGVNMVVIDSDAMAVSATSWTTNSAYTAHSYVMLAGGAQNSSGTANLYSVGYGSGASGIQIIQSSFSKTGGLTQTTIANIAQTSFDTEWTNIICYSALYDQTDGNLVLSLYGAGTISAGHSNYAIAKVSTVSGAVLWSSPVNNYFNNGPQSVLANGTFAFAAQGTETFVGARDASPSGYTAVFVIDTASGAVTRQDWPITYHEQTQVYDSESGSITYWGNLTSVGYSSNHWMMIFPIRGNGTGTTLDKVVTDICETAGFVSADLNVTALASTTVDGYVIASQKSAKQALAPLASAYFFDACESEYVLKFVMRGMTPLATIPYTDLGIIDSKTNATSQETRTQEVDISSQISVQFFDSTRDYQQSTQYARRPFNPVPTMYSRVVDQANYDLVLTPTEAKQIGERLLYTAWTERVGYKLNLPWNYLLYDPTDVLTVTLSDTSTVDIRFNEVQIGANLTNTVQAVGQDVASYSSTATGNGGDGFVNQTVSSSATGKLILLDIPYLRDTDNVGQTYTILYFTAGAYNESSFKGLECYKSADLSSWLDAGPITSPAPWGTAVNALGNTATPFGPDYTNSLTVGMVQGGEQLSSATLLAVCNGANVGALISSDGTIEIIQWQTATVNTDGTYTLSGLLRGRRGTEVYTGNHSIGDTFVVLATASTNYMSTALADLNVARYYKGVPSGTLLENATQQTLTDTGRTLKPYAPVHMQAATSGSDLALSWVRRTRFGGELADYTGTVPLNEDTEAYQVDIYDALGSTVLRTLSASGTPGVTYTSAEITTDFGSTPATLTMAVYQISGEIGRGFGKKVTVTVNGPATP